MTILNLTQHLATPEQKAVGVVDLSEPERTALRTLLTFNDLPTRDEVKERARSIAALAFKEFKECLDSNNPEVMVGGAPFLMADLCLALAAYGIKPVFAFTKREVIESLNLDGTVTKVAVFKHAGFVPAY